MSKSRLSCLETSFRFLFAARPRVKSNEIQCTATPAFVLPTWFVSPKHLPSSPFLLPAFLWQGRTVIRATALRGTSLYSSPDCNPYNITITEIKPVRCFIFPRSQLDLGLVLCLSIDGRPASFLFPPKAHSAVNSLTALEKLDSEKPWGRNSVFIQKCSLEVTVSFICLPILL